MHGLHFRRQGVIGPYYVDFLCNSIKLVIELDGGQHSEREAYDERRTRYLEERGYRVLRYWNHDVLLRISSVLEDIAFQSAPPQPSPTPAAKGRES
jgi:adenine-specific DNA-methyltransferase